MMMFDTDKKRPLPRARWLAGLAVGYWDGLDDVRRNHDGNVVLVLSTRGMYRGWIRPDGSRGTGVHED